MPCSFQVAQRVAMKQGRAGQGATAVRVENAVSGAAAASRPVQWADGGRDDGWFVDLLVHRHSSPGRDGHKGRFR
jgi:hypothetical protein